MCYFNICNTLDEYHLSCENAKASVSNKPDTFSFRTGICVALVKLKYFSV